MRNQHLLSGHIGTALASRPPRLRYKRKWKQMKSQKQMFGQEDFPVKTSVLPEWDPEKGLRGRQSGLFYVFAKLIEARRPPVIVIENVAALLSSNEGRDFAIVIRSLAELGYGLAWRVLDSRYFGIPQSRSRVFIVGSLRGSASAGSVLF